MAAGDSVVSIVTAGLILLGEDPIVSVFPPDNTKRAILAAQRYDALRRAVLAAYPWRCNKVMLQLAASPTVPLFRWGAAYPLPANVLGVDELSGMGRESWEVIGQSLMTNASSGGGGTLNLIAGLDLQDPTMFEPLLAEAISCALAVDLCPALAQDRVERDDLMKIFDGKVELAQFTSSRAASVSELDIDLWLRARR